jgi:glycosyltransferase involved in cell wall biosynthesis
MPKVSICIPAYRQPVFLQKTLQSVIIQSFTDYEVIVTDDSPDDSVENVLREYSSDIRFKYFKNNETKGSPENWNEGVRHACGDYIKMLHHDDWFSGSESLGKYVKMLDDNPNADFAFSSTIVSSITNATRIHSPSERKRERLKKDPRTLFYGNIIGAPSATIYRSGFQLEYDLHLKWLVDIDFYMQLLLRNRFFVFSDEPLIFTTDEAPHQVTNECLINKNLLLFEHIHVFKKSFDIQHFDLRHFRLFWNILGKFKVDSVQEIYEAGVSDPIPAVVLSVIGLRRILGW